MVKTSVSLIREALIEISVLMQKKFEEERPLVRGSALEQSGLENGAEIVNGYLEHNEVGLAYEHLLYMVMEPPLIVSLKCYQLIVSAGIKLGYDPDYWQGLQIGS